MSIMPLHHHSFDGVDQRSANRQEIGVLRLSYLTTAPVKALLCAISSAGVLVKIEEEIAVGEVLEMRLQGGKKIRGRVTWSNNSLFGCKFDTPASANSINAALGGADQWAGAAQSSWLGELGQQYSGRDPESWPRPLRIALISGCALTSWLGIAMAIGLGR